MTKMTNDCVGCPPEMGCMASCTYKHAMHYYCDKCGEEVQPEDLWRTDEGDLCMDCAVGTLTKTDMECAVREIYPCMADVLEDY